MFLSVLALISVLALADQAFAQDDWTKGFLIRARGIAVVPDESSTVTPIGGEVKIDNAVAPELDLSYFFTENLALEVIAATTKHDARASGTSLGNLDLGEFWILPPTLLAQFHLPLGNFKPYIGAGVNYTITYGEDAAGGPVDDLDIDNGFGWAAQIGVDYMLDEHWLINADIKKLWLNLDAKVNNGAARADIDVDPWIFGIGVGYRF
jgi:outer membrane protein